MSWSAHLRLGPVPSRERYRLVRTPIALGGILFLNLGYRSRKVSA